MQLERLNIQPAEVGFDIDGVVADTMEAFIRLARDDYGIATILPEHITDFMVEDCLDIEPDIVDAIFARLLNEPLQAGLTPMAHAVQVLTEFADSAPLTFITARPARAPIEEWLITNLGRDIYKKTRLIATGEHDSKAEYIKEMGLKYFIDDRAQTCILLEQEDIIPIVYNQPWNAGRHNLASVDNWLAIRDMVY